MVECLHTNPPPGPTISHVLVVDPDPTSRESIANCLSQAGHRVRVAGSGEEGLRLAHEDPPLFVITELALPDLSGLGLCRGLREDPVLCSVPILMLTSSDAEMDRVVAFELGVDDFVAKPFHARELALRVAAILRRSHKRAPTRLGETLHFGRLSVDLGQHEARVDQQPVALTAREFDILVHLMQSSGRVLSRQQILEQVWGARSGKTARVVDTHVKWIRRKLGPANHYIETLRGVGYRFLDDLDSAKPLPPEHDAPALYS